MKANFTFKEIKQKLVNYCVYQDRCHQEVEQKMREFLLIPEAKEEIYLHLITENYLNEERFTRSYIRGKFNLKNWGKNKIRNHLHFKGISDKLIDLCMDEIEPKNYHDTIKKMAESYSSKLKGLQVYQKQIKTTRYLLTKGFEYEEIKEVLKEQ